MFGKKLLLGGRIIYSGVIKWRERMIDLTYDKEKIFKKLSELEKEIPVLLTRIRKAKIEVMNIQTLEDAKRFEEENDLDGDLMHIEVF